MDNNQNFHHNGLGEDESLLHRRYQEAVERLNGLQSNAATLSKAIARGRSQSSNVEDTRKRLRRCGLSVDDLQRLNAIHVSGTKGKGSTCAYAESLLRHRGFKTGLYSSPHLIEVRERIRINGRPLSKTKFVRHFWEVYNKLDSTKDQESGAMPAYFSFLTLLGFHVFLAEQVDVALVEVGIGGRFDCTNVIEKPVSVGISSLGHDHMSILGNTLEEIAWNKAGIMKTSCCAIVTSPGQPPEALSVLSEEAAKLHKTVAVAPPLESYPLPPTSTASGIPQLGIGGCVQSWNASLALQLTESWRRWRNGEIEPVAPFPLDDIHLTALAQTQWFGRCSVVDRSSSVRLHLDGAHTPESVEFCARWFQGVAGRPRILVFNVFGDRDGRSLLEELKGLEFDFVIFCPNIVTATDSDAPDVQKSSVTRTVQLNKCQKLLAMWLQLSSCPPANATCVSSVEEALAFLEKADSYLPEPFASAARIDVLITGSLHLVGDFFALLSPEMND